MFRQDKPNMRVVAKGDTTEVVSRHLSIVRIYDIKSQAHAAVHLSSYQNRSQVGRMHHLDIMTRLVCVALFY